MNKAVGCRSVKRARFADAALGQAKASTTLDTYAKLWPSGEAHLWPSGEDRTRGGRRCFDL